MHSSSYSTKDVIIILPYWSVFYCRLELKDASLTSCTSITGSPNSFEVYCVYLNFLRCCLFCLVAVEDVALLDHPFLLDPWTSTYCNHSGLLIHDDNVTEDIETLQLQILPSSATTVDPTRQFLTIYIVDNDSEFQSSIIICSCHFSLSCCVFLFSSIAHLALPVCHA